MQAVAVPLEQFPLNTVSVRELTLRCYAARGTRTVRA
jgi:hypothetical protein